MCILKLLYYNDLFQGHRKCGIALLSLSPRHKVLVIISSKLIFVWLFTYLKLTLSHYAPLSVSTFIVYASSLVLTVHIFCLSNCFLFASKIYTRIEAFTFSLYCSFTLYSAYIRVGRQNLIQDSKLLKSFYQINENDSFP